MVSSAKLHPAGDDRLTAQRTSTSIFGDFYDM